MGRKRKELRAVRRLNLSQLSHGLRFHVKNITAEPPLDEYLARFTYAFSLLYSSKKFGFEIEQEKLALNQIEDCWYKRSAKKLVAIALEEFIHFSNFNELSNSFLFLAGRADSSFGNPRIYFRPTFDELEVDTKVDVSGDRISHTLKIIYDNEKERKTLIKVLSLIKSKQQSTDFLLMKRDKEEYEAILFVAGDVYKNAIETKQISSDLYWKRIAKEVHYSPIVIYENYLLVGVVSERANVLKRVYRFRVKELMSDESIHKLALTLMSNEQRPVSIFLTDISSFKNPTVRELLFFGLCYNARAYVINTLSSLKTAGEELVRLVNIFNHIRN